MSRLGIFIADGCEEVEALTVVDIVRRAKLEIDMISINGTKQVTSSRNVTFMTDTTKEEADFSAYDGIILPGGMPGTVHLGEDDTVSQVSMRCRVRCQWHKCCGNLRSTECTGTGRNFKWEESCVSSGI
mgnify:CR=1 FL=1